MEIRVNQIQQALPVEQTQSTASTDGTFKFMLASNIEEAELQDMLRSVFKGEAIEDGMDLEAEGYQGLLLTQNDKGANVLYGKAWIDVDASNMDDYDF